MLLREDKSEKIDYTYLPLFLPVTNRIMKRFMEGSRKYARANWRECTDNSTYKESLMRHMMQYMSGETDEDHLAAITANAIILMDLENVESIE